MKLLKNILQSTLVMAFFCLSSCSHAQSSDAQFSIASQEYVDLASEAFDHIESFDFPQFFEMLSSDIEYYFPDGDAGTRTSLIGKNAVMDFWNSYPETSGNDKMVISNEVHLPVEILEELNYTKLTGIMVISYFSNELTFGSEKANVRMNFGMHFNQDKKIDRIYTYYDRSPIISAAQRNILKSN